MKIIVFIFIFFTLAYSSYEQVKIGKIDNYYGDKITKHELITMIKEIEDIFESQLGFNVFDYSEDGKPIDLLYLPPSKKRYQLDKTVKESQMKKKRIEILQMQIVNKQERLIKDQSVLQDEYDLLNKDINQFNSYIQKLQEKKLTSKFEYEEIKKDVNLKQKKLNGKKDRFNQKKTKYNSLVSSYNQLTSRYNTLVSQYNRAQRKIETLSRSIQEVKGVAKGYTQTILETYKKNGKTYSKTEVKNYMEKIELYDFESKAQLKATLAHELAHLIGVGHIHVQGALMNPLLQDNQIKNLYLTPEDIKEFEKSFN